MSDEQTESSESVYRLMGIASGVGTPIAFAFVGMAALDSLVYGVAAGLLTGVGSLLFVPWFVRLANDSEETDRSFGELLQASPGSLGRRLFGLGLDLGGIVMIAVGFATDEPNLLVGLAAGFSVALAVYLAGSVGLGRLTPAGG